MASNNYGDVAIGIDLGTTNSCVAIFRNGQVEVIPNENGIKITPSIVSFGETERVIGDQAKHLSVTDPDNTVYEIKRLMGRAFNDPSIQNDIRHWPFKVIDVNGKPAVQVKYMGQEKIFQPEEISAMVLEKMKAIAEAHLGHEVRDAVITVPAYFDNNQRQATKIAGEIAGLNVLRLMNEPTAAAVAYGLDKRGGGQRNILVYDLGGGTFDISVLSLDGGSFRVKATLGDSHLGGKDFDTNMVEHFAREIKKKHNKDIMANKYALRRLSVACEKAKVKLSASTQANFDIPELLPNFDLETSITRPLFEELNSDLFNGTIEKVKEALKESGLDKSRMDDVVLVGGSTRILKVQSLLKEFFNRQKLNKGINPDEAVAYGAAVQAALMKGDPSKKLENLLLYDVVPLSLGVNVIGGRMSTIVERNSPIPIEREKNYTTTVDNQTGMNFKVYEGERLLVADNNYLGEMHLEGIPPEPRGYASVNVVFEIDEDCILNAKAIDEDSGNQTHVQIVNNSKKLNREQVDRLVEIAQANRLQDAANVERIEAMNDLEFYINDIKSALGTKDFDSNIPPRQKQELLNQVQLVRDWLDSSLGKTAKMKVYREKQASLESIWNPIFTVKASSSYKSLKGNKPVFLLGD